MVEDRIILQWYTDRKSYMICRMVLLSVNLEWCLNQISRAHYYLLLYVSEMVQVRHMVTPAGPLIKSDTAAYWTVPSPMTLIDLQGHFSSFCLIISLLFQCLRDSRGDLVKDDIASDLWLPKKVISGTINGIIVSAKYSIYAVFEVNTSYVRAVICSHFWLVGLLYDAQLTC